MRKPVNVVIIASPTELDKQTLESHIATIVDVLTPLCGKLFLIAGTSPYDNSRIRLLKVRRWRDREKDFILLKFISRIITELKLTLSLLKIILQTDVVLYYVGAKGYLLSLFAARALRRKIVVCSFSSMSKVAKVMVAKRSFIRHGIIPTNIFNILEKITLTLAHRIWVESENVIGFSGLENYKDKITICRISYIDTTRFRPKMKLDNRRTTIGYLGRFDENKGVLNFVKAFPLILRSRSDVEFILYGGGELKSMIDEEIKINHLSEKVKLTGEIPRNKVPECMNELKLFVLPSYSEGLPKVILEAMACGTPVLTTPVGGIPDIIKDGETGFITEDNSPECIARNVIRAIEHPDLREIAHNAVQLIEREYAYKVVVEACRVGLEEITQV